MCCLTISLSILGHLVQGEAPLIGLAKTGPCSLEEALTEEEVKAVVMDIPTEKAPGPDGFIGIFFQANLGGYQG